MIVLDTHAWWVSDRRRLGKLGRAMLKAADEIGVPAVCAFGAVLVTRDRRIRAFAKVNSVWDQVRLQ